MARRFVNNAGIDDPDRSVRPALNDHRELKPNALRPVFVGVGDRKRAALRARFTLRKVEESQSLGVGFAATVLADEGNAEGIIILFVGGRRHREPNHRAR